MKSSTCLVVFAKAPVAGYAKTRLIPALGAQGAADLAEQLLKHAVSEAVSAAIGSVELCVSPDTLHPVFQSLKRDYAVDVTPQGDGDLGARMLRTFEQLLATHSRVILIGTDAPALDAAMLQQAHHALEHHDAVFVPAHDGGYALVGLRAECPALFTDMAWSTSTVMQETRKRALNAALHWHECAPVHDMDEPADLIHLPTGWMTASEPLSPP